MSDPRWIIFDGTFREAGDRLIPAESRAVWYGDGCFETLRAYCGKFLKLDLHLERMSTGLRYLGISHPRILEPGKMKEELLRVLAKNGLLESEALVRIQVWREGERGFDASGQNGSGYAVSAFPLPEIANSVRLAVVPTRRIPAAAVNPGIKLSNSINYIRAAMEASTRGAEDALMLTTDGLVSETTKANIFWSKSGTVYTPSEECDILPGVTRSMIIMIIKEMDGVSLETGRFSPGDLQGAEAAWICNSVRELVPVSSVGPYEFKLPHPLFTRIASTFRTFRDNELM